MSAAFVVDCSVTMTWLFPDEATLQTAELLDRLSDESAVAPGWWYLEVTNVLALAERKGRITAAQSAEFIADLCKLGLEIANQSAGRAFDHLLPLARTHQLTTYDAMYLDLAVRCNLPLATLDDQLRKAATKLSVKLLGR